MHGRLGGEVFGRGTLDGLGVGEVELGLALGVEFDLGGKRPARLGTETLQGADLALPEEKLDLLGGEGAAGHALPEEVVASRAAEAAVFLLQRAGAALRALHVQFAEVTLHCVALEVAGARDDVARQVADAGHEDVPAQAAGLHLLEPALPFAGELGLGQGVHAEGAQERDERGALGRGVQLAAVAQDVFVLQEALDDGGAGGRRAEALGGHGGAQLLVLHELAGALHRGEQRGLVVAGGRLGLEFPGFDVRHAGGLTLDDGDEFVVAVGGVAGRRGGGAAIDGHPTRVGDDLALGLEVFPLHDRDARRHLELRGGEEHRDEAPGDQVVELHLRFVQAGGRGLGGGDDGVVV